MTSLVDDDAQALRDRAAQSLFQHCSLEMTAKDIDKLYSIVGLLPSGTRIAITSLPSENEDAQVCAARAARRAGFAPVPHIAARRVQSKDSLREHLARLRAVADVDRAFVIAGDTAVQRGPYKDAMGVLESGVLAEQGIRHVGIAGYPEGHPTIADEILWQALWQKHQLLLGAGVDVEIVTQFSFDAEKVMRWLARLRALQIKVPVRIGIPGPASLKTLLKFAAVCGVSASSRVLANYGFSLGQLLGTAGPDRLLHALLREYDVVLHGVVRVHIFPFGGLERAAQWTQSWMQTSGQDSFVRLR
jgi:methylenetetrahydrofolate reductase (NADPH)